MSAPACTGPEDYQADIDELVGKAHALRLGQTPIHFRMASQADLTEIASFGLPNRFNHWYFGGIYKSLKTQQEQEVFKILELVLNTDPAYAFLLDTNTRLENLTVIAHVLGHVDFFVENRWYARSDKDMLNRCEQHARAIRTLRDQHGAREVDDLITAALTLATGATAFERDPAIRQQRPFYFVLEQLSRLAERPSAPPERKAQASLAVRILEMMRREHEYFDLIARTQIMNEGWASFVEFKLLEDHLDASHWTDFSLGFSRRPPPYVIGFTLYQDLFRRKGWEGVFEVRKYYEDVAFVDELLTAELARALDLFVVDRETGARDDDLRKVKAKMIEEKLHKGAPLVVVSPDQPEDGQLLLVHQDPERTLDRKRAELYLREVHRLWPEGVRLLDNEHEYRYGEAGFQREKR